MTLVADSANGSESSVKEKREFLGLDGRSVKYSPLDLIVACGLKPVGRRIFFFLCMLLHLQSSPLVAADEDFVFKNSVNPTSSPSRPQEDKPGTITGNTVLSFLEHVMSVLGDDEEFQLGAKWREEDGRFKQMKLELKKERHKKIGEYSALAVDDCQSLMGFTDVSGSDGDTSYEVAYCSGLNYYNYFADCYYVPPAACVYVSGNYDKINMNYNSYTGEAQSKNLPLYPSLLGASCKDCYAYAGANLGFLIYCTEYSCIIDFEAGGSAKYNVDFEMNDPVLDMSQIYYTPLKTPLTGTPAYIPEDDYELLGTIRTSKGNIYIEVATDLSIGKSLKCDSDCVCV